jgi:hypothetical protein
MPGRWDQTRTDFGHTGARQNNAVLSVVNRARVPAGSVGGSERRGTAVGQSRRSCGAVARTTMGSTRFPRLGVMDPVIERRPRALPPVLSARVGASWAGQGGL